MNPQIYLVKDAKLVSMYIDAEIGIEYDITDENEIVVFEPTQKEHKKIRAFINNNYLWLDKEPKC